MSSLKNASLFGNATIERGFSINKDTTSQRMMYDTVYYFGGPEKVPITKKTIFRFRAARTNYHIYLEEPSNT
jgi:hypothetical protein